MRILFLYGNMSKLKIKKAKEKKLIWMKFRRYIDFIILICCCIVAFNIHPSNITENEDTSSNKSTMIYIFHDYKWNEYIMNDHVHGAPSSWDYLFEDEVPNDLKWDENEFTDSVSLGDFSDSEEWESITGEVIDNYKWIKDNQISLGEIISDLWIDYQNTGDSGLSTSNDSDTLIIAIWDTENDSEEDYYTVKEVIVSGDTSSLIIEKANNSTENTNSEIWIKHIENNSVNSVEIETVSSGDNDTNSYSNENTGSVIKSFKSVEETWILPVLTPWNDLFFDYNTETVTYFNGLGWDNYLINQGSNSSGITIINNYPSCMTPWWYKITHGDSVLAYKQMDNAPDICNIERRFCRKWKLSWTYTQQWCSVNKNYTYEKRGTSNTKKDTDNENQEFKWWTRQNSDGSVTVKNSEIWWSFVFDRPNNTYSDFSKTDNIIAEEQWIKQTSRPYPDCTAPRWEKVKHWQFIQAFKHANWFSDAPCEAQIRLCSVWQLMWTYTESTCKTWDTSFIDRVNGSSSWKTYSKEKIEWVKRQIKNEQDYYEKTRESAGRSTNSDALDRILYILDQNN